MKRKKYAEYDVDATFRKNVADASEEQIDMLLRTGRIKCSYATKTITSGKQIEIEIYPEFTRKQISSDSSIKKKRKVSQDNLNDKNSRKYLTRLINTNFSSGDIWVTLTYDDDHLPDSVERAVRNMQNYIRKINRVRKKRELPKAKYIYITERGRKGRFHHHMIIDHVQTMDELESMWSYGRRNNTRKVREDDQGLTGLANYISKVPKDDRSKGQKRWNASKGLKKPTVRKNHYEFSMKKIRKMTQDHNMVRAFIEKMRPGLRYIEDRCFFNEFNSRTYFYIRMSVP